MLPFRVTCLATRNSLRIRSLSLICPDGFLSRFAGIAEPQGIVLLHWMVFHPQPTTQDYYSIPTNPNALVILF